MNNIGNNYLSQINALLKRNKVGINILSQNENTYLIQKGITRTKENASTM